MGLCTAKNLKTNIMCLDLLSYEQKQKAFAGRNYRASCESACASLRTVCHFGRNSELR